MKDSSGELARAATVANNERDEAKKERDALAKLLRDIVAAYGNTGKVGTYTPEEIALERCIDAARIALELTAHPQ